MEQENYKSYRTDPTFHTVNVFHLYSNYRFMNISCKICKLHDKCHDIKHKREICKAAKDTERYFANFIHGNISSFSSDDFYIYGKHKKSEIYIKQMADKILSKYVKKENVRS